MTQPDLQRSEITVVNHEGELLFRTDDLLFDVLNASPEFGGGKLSVYRSGQLLDQTEHICEVGDLVPRYAFCGLKSSPDAGSQYSTRGIAANNFQEGDRLVLEIPTNGPWNLANHLRITSGLLNATRAAFDRKREWKLGDLRKAVNAEMEQNATALASVQIVRFRNS